MTCPYHGHDPILCPDCKRESKARERESIRSGQSVYAVLLWRGDGRYDLTQALKTYRIKSAAERYADRLNADLKDSAGYVVRTVRSA